MLEKKPVCSFEVRCEKWDQINSIYEDGMRHLNLRKKGAIKLSVN